MYKRVGQIESLVEYNVYGDAASATKLEPMFIGRVITVGNHRAGFEPIADFKTPDDGAQYSAYVEEIKLKAARFDLLLDLLSQYGPDRALEQMRRFMEPKA